jgi:FemAB-related protein (PEP-CTERM system-associated)
MMITEMKNKDSPAWDAYVRSAACGLPYHLSSWREVLTDTYGYETHFLMAKEEERIVGVLPLLVVRSFLIGDRVMTVQGGLCADNEEVALVLIERGKELAEQAGVERLVIQDTRETWPGDLRTTTNHVHWVVDVSEKSDALWKGLHRNIRRQVRMARKKGVTVRIDRDGESADQFYNILSQYARGAGTPLFGRDFLDNVIRAFPGRFNIAMVYSGEKPVGGYFQLVMGDTVYGAWGATLHEYLSERPTYLAYWEMLADTAENGYRYLDMGRSPAESNISAFKGQWGGVSKPIYQQIASIGEERGETSVTGRIQSDTKFQLFMKMWPHLPLSFVQFFGPKLRRHVPFA